MVRRVLYPPTWVLSISIALVGVVALIGIAIGVFNLQRTAEQAARAEADKARAEAILTSQCRIIDLYRVKPGDAAPTTERGRELATSFQREWERLGCR